MSIPFSIIIPTWNNLPFLQLCIASIRKHSAAEHQIIIHVNEGTDGTLEWVRAQGFDYTFTERNVGVCIACNIMRTKVKTDYILYLNDDMYVLPGWDTALSDEVAKLPNNRFYLCGTEIQCRHTIKGGAQAWYGDTVENFEEERLLREYRDIELPDCCGALWPPSLLHRDIWDMVGGFSIEFSPGMASDPDLTAKLAFVGVDYLKGVSACRVYHFETKSTSRVKRNDGRLQLILKWGLSYRFMRSHLWHQGLPWAQRPQAGPDDKVLRKARRRYRMKAVWELLTGGQLGPIEPLQ